MGLFDRFFVRDKASAGVPSQGMIPMLGSLPSASGMLISQASSMTDSAVYACVRRRAIDVARCKPSLYTLNPDGSRKPVTNHAVNKLLTRPNRQQNWLEWMEQMEIGYLLRGNAFSPVRRDSRGSPVELIPVNPDAVLVLEASDGQIFYNVNRLGLWQIAMLRDFPTAIPEEDMLHLRGMVFNALVGVSTIGLARDTIGLAMGLDQQANRMIANGARPSGVLETPNRLSSDAAKRLSQTWKNAFSAVQNTGETPILEEKLTYKQMQLTSVDMEFMAQRNFEVLQVCRFFGVPPHKIGADSGAKGATQNIPQQDQDYVNSTIAQDVERWELKLQQYFELDEDGIYVNLDMTQLLRADILTRRNAARLGILSALTTPDEERAAEGLPPKGGRADELQYPANTAALGSDVTGTGPDQNGRPTGGNLPKPGVPTSGDNGESGVVDEAPSD